MPIRGYAVGYRTRQRPAKLVDDCWGPIHLALCGADARTSSATVAPLQLDATRAIRRKIRHLRADLRAKFPSSTRCTGMGMSISTLESFVFWLDSVREPSQLPQ